MGAGPARSAVVVGGSTGIGRGIADAWAAAGWRTHVLSRSRPAGPGARDLVWHPVDLRDTDAAAAALASIPLSTHLVCYSAITFGARRRRLHEVPEQEWADQLAVNLTGLWLTLRATLPALRTHGRGRFVHVSSEVVYNAGPDRSGYAATKAAASALVRSVAQEEHAVRFTEVLPEGMVDSPGIRARRAPDFDYAGYMAPSDFGPVAVDLAQDTGGLLPPTIVVEPGGRWRPLAGEPPVSQSRPALASTGGADRG